jgi:LemA protein
LAFSCSRDFAPRHGNPSGRTESAAGKIGDDAPMTTIAELALLFVGAGCLWYIATIYNGLIALQNDIDKAWANIDVLLKQRHDELPKLLDVCKGYMDYERDTLQRITQVRSQYQQAVTVGQKAEADRDTAYALRGFFAVAENYPELKANGNFLQLQNRITELESQIADRREFYNDSVNTFNTRIRQMPDTFVASFMNAAPHPMFQVAESEKAGVSVGLAAAN